MTENIFLEIVIVLFAAKLVGELAERVGLPAVCGEIVAGLVIGPSALGLVEPGEVLTVLGEIGVILLLFGVGMETELSELLAVGRASLLVAVTGVVLPFVTGLAVGHALGFDGNEAVFVAAALTATSVGITARVFGDLKALGTREARTVLGAAVADDVMGLIILTVVVGSVTQGDVSIGYVAGITAGALAFLVVAAVVGRLVAPGLFALVERWSRSEGTLVVLALAFTLGVAVLAEEAKLAPIVGAFVAGLAVRESHLAHRVQRELAPVGHLFIPVFFLQIGIEADIGQFGSAEVLRDAGLLLVVAVIGKVASGYSLRRSDGDRLLIGVGMIPRGEVGLIFATIGLEEGVFGDDVYAALLLVVLLTTIVTPPILRVQVRNMVARAARVPAVEPVSPDEVLVVVPGAFGDTVELGHDPAPDQALSVALEAATRCQNDRPGGRLVDWLQALPPEPLPWTPDARRALLELLGSGGPRSWRFLSVTGVLDRALPELAETLAARQSDLSEVDPVEPFRWPRLARVVDDPDWHSLGSPGPVAMAALVLDVTRGGPPVPVAEHLVERIGFAAADAAEITALVGDVDLVEGSARRLGVLADDNVRLLAVHLGSSDRARAVRVLARGGGDRSVRAVELLDRVITMLEATGTGSPGAGGHLDADRRRATAAGLADESATADRVRAAPAVHALAVDARTLLAHAALLEPPLELGEVRAEVTASDTPAAWRVEVAARGRRGLLAAVAGALADREAVVRSARLASWPDDSTIVSMHVESPSPPSTSALTADVRARDEEPLIAVPDAVVEFDDRASPWHTVCYVCSESGSLLLRPVGAALAACGVRVHAAWVTNIEGRTQQELELSEADGTRLAESTKQAIRDALVSGKPPTRRRVRSLLGRR